MILIAVNSLAQPIRFIFNACHQLQETKSMLSYCQQVKIVTGH
jgi:hypothetical protein